MDTTLMSLVLLICFIVIAFIYERFFNNGRSNKDQASRKKEENSGRPLVRYKHKKSTL